VVYKDEHYHEVVARFERIVRTRSRQETMVALIVDSPWLPGFAGLNTLDFLFEPDAWLEAYEKAHRALPGAVFVPDVWVEYGMAAEPSGWGVPIRWHGDAPPSIKPLPGGIEGLLAADLPDPERDGLMPVVLRRYERMKPALAERGFAPRLAAARGPLAVAGYLVGLTELLVATRLEPENCLALIERTTELCIRWLSCQLERMDHPLGVLVLDDVVGLIGPADAEIFAFPFLERIFKAFDGLIHIFHNDTPNKAVYPGLAGIGMDVFNHSHEVDVGETRRLLGPDIVLMGNVPPLDILVRGTPDEVRAAADSLLKRTAEVGPLLLSPGGGVSPGTPIANLNALLDVVNGG